MVLLARGLDYCRQLRCGGRHWEHAASAEEKDGQTMPKKASKPTQSRLA
jgi:hypothetical protein